MLFIMIYHIFNGLDLGKDRWVRYFVSLDNFIKFNGDFIRDILYFLLNLMNFKFDRWEENIFLNLLFFKVINHFINNIFSLINILDLFIKKMGFKHILFTLIFLYLLFYFI